MFLGSLSGTTLIKQHSNDLYISHMFVDILKIWESCPIDKLWCCRTSIIWALLSRALPTIVTSGHIQESTHLFNNYKAQSLSNFYNPIQSNLKLLGWSNWAPNSDGIIIGPYQHKLLAPMGLNRFVKWCETWGLKAKTFCTSFRFSMGPYVCYVHNFSRNGFHANHDPSIALSCSLYLKHETFIIVHV